MSESTKELASTNNVIEITEGLMSSNSKFKSFNVNDAIKYIDANFECYERTRDINRVYGDIDFKNVQYDKKLFDEQDELYGKALCETLDFVMNLIDNTNDDYAIYKSSSFQYKVISWRFVIKNRIATYETNKQFIEKLNEFFVDKQNENNLIRILDFDTSIYNQGRKMRMINSSKPNEKRPLVMVKGEIIDSLITYIPEGCNMLVQVEEEKETPEYPNITSNIYNKEVEDLCNLLDDNFLSSYDNWIRFLICLKTQGEQYKQLFLDICAKSPRYNKKHIIAENAKAWTKMIITTNRITLGSLKHWAKKCNPKAYFELKKTQYSTLLLTQPLTSNELCEVFTIEMAGDILYSESQKTFYVYNQNNGLWEDKTINNIFTSRIQSIIQKLIGELPLADSEEQIAINLKKTKHFMSIMSLCDGFKVNNLINKYLPSMCCENGEDPFIFMNLSENCLNLKNGVWDFKQKKLVSYDRNHYFTFKLDIEYNSNADTIDIHNAFKAWFKNDTDVMKWVQYYLGYCLTGYVDLQELLFVWGESASNGKSTLFNDIMGSILGHNKLMAILNSTDIQNKGDNNDGLYQLNGKRFALISEPSKNKKGVVEFDNQMMKNISGDSVISAQAKYKGKITFKVLSKIGFIFNQLPEIEFEDEGSYRRMTILEMNVSFKNEDDYEKCPQHLKEKGLIQKKDPLFIKRLMENKEGILKYLLEGADVYMTYKDKGQKYPTPESMKNSKTKAVKELDVLGGWIDNRIVYEEGSKIKKSELLRIWNDEKLSFGQGIKGFVERLKKKVMSKGYEWEEGSKGKGRECVVNAKLIDDDDDDDKII